MSKIPNNIHIIYGLAKNFGWDEYTHYVREVGREMKRPKADSFDIIRIIVQISKVKKKDIDPSKVHKIAFSTVEKIAKLLN